jgi:flagellar biosynthesis/type III secretory pathway protein FliH
MAAEEHQARASARQVLEAAEEAACRTRERAQAEREQVLAEAERAGREEGMARAAAALAAAGLARDRLLAAAERDLVRLAVTVAGRIVGEEGMAAESARASAARALAQVRARRVVTLRVHPEDAETVRRAEPRLRGLLEHPGALDLREDPAVGRGGAVVETEAEGVDARLQAQLELLLRAMEEAVAP